MKNLTPASDQFSLGVIAYVCATGQLPFMVEDEQNFVARAVKTQAGRYEPMHVRRPDLSPEFEGVVARMLKPAIGERFPAVREVGLALLPLADERVRERYASRFGVAPGSIPLRAATTIDENASTLPEHGRTARPTTLGGSISVVDAPPQKSQRSRVATLAALLAASALLTVGVLTAMRIGAQSDHAATMARDAAVRPTPITPVAPTSVAQPVAPPPSESAPQVVAVAAPVARATPSVQPSARGGRHAAAHGATRGGVQPVLMDLRAQPVAQVAPRVTPVERPVPAVVAPPPPMPTRPTEDHEEFFNR